MASMIALCMTNKNYGPDDFKCFDVDYRAETSLSSLKVIVFLTELISFSYKGAVAGVQLGIFKFADGMCILNLLCKPLCAFLIYRILHERGKKNVGRECEARAHQDISF